MFDIAGPVVDWLNANPELAGLVTFIISAAESIAIIGTIVPGSVMMTAIGALVGAGIIPVWSTLIWAILGAIAGDGVSYWLGYHFKDRIYEVWPFKQHPKILQAGEVFFRKHGSLSVFIGRFVGPVRALVPVVAGMFGMRPLIFTIANVTSAILWAPAYMLPGFLLGAASQELPSELAGHLVLTFLLWLLFAFLLIWMLRKSFKMILTKINQFLNWIWDSLEKSRYFNVLIPTHKPRDAKKLRSQLKAAFYLVLMLTVLFYLALAIISQGSANIAINKVMFYLSRSLRSDALDHYFLLIYFLGCKDILIPLIVMTFICFAWKKHWRIARHTLSLGVLLTASIYFFTHAVHSIKPWGVVNNPVQGYSFPSESATLAFTIYFGIALLIIHLYKINRYKPIMFLTSLIVILVSAAQVYFGIQWFTDILGGWLLAAIILMTTTLSYQRKPEKPIQPRAVMRTIIYTLGIAYSLNLNFSHTITQHNLAKLDWPTYHVNLDDWWQQKGAHLPLYRINRLGLKTKIFNLQWVGELEDIQQLLLTNGWEVPPPSDWISAMYRLSSVESTAHLPLVQPLYLDRAPTLVLTKLMDHKKLLILRFWQSNIILDNEKHPLWVGIIEIAPSTYSWLFKKKNYPEASFSPDWIFTQLPSAYDLKLNEVKVKTNHHHSKNIPMILIKPKLGI